MTIVAIIIAKIAIRMAMDVITSSLRASSICDVIGGSIGGDSALLTGEAEGGVSSRGGAILICSRGEDREGEGGARGMSPGARYETKREESC